MKPPELGDYVKVEKEGKENDAYLNAMWYPRTEKRHSGKLVKPE